MLIVETQKKISPSNLRDELADAGINDVGVIRVTTRRRVDGVVLKNQPRALVVEGVGEEAREAVESVLESHSTLEELRAGITGDLKREAGRRILTRIPDWKQRNYLAFSLEMTRKGTVTPEEQGKLNFIEGEWLWVQSVRDKSDELEAVISTADEETLDSFDPRADDHWPA